MSPGKRAPVAEPEADTPSAVLCDPAPAPPAAEPVVLVDPKYDHTIRWRPGERLDHLFERRCDELREAGEADHIAVHAGGVALRFDELDARANQLARALIAAGAAPGDRIGLLFDDATRGYVAMLAVMKANAAYVPLDVGFPADRLAYIAEDAGVRMVLSLSHLAELVSHLPAAALLLDQMDEQVSALDARRLTAADKGAPVDELCYIIYTSGSTGRPKGVPIEHASICNFVRVAAEVYGYERHDRVYQGMTIAFDFSVEEIWVPLIAGATLVPKPGGASLVGPDLDGFIAENGITALCCVPTLLATLDEKTSKLRFLLVSGEACPEDLIARWHRPDRRFLNVYGPTETTVSATWAVASPDGPVTIGVPLPTYSAVILDPEADRALAVGEVGEIGIAGIGLATGYLNRDDLTRRVFIPDFLGIDNNPSSRIYRTGDLGRVNAEGEIEYLGRIDTQVKIRGYRIELTEIESVLLGAPDVGQAVVDTYQPSPDSTELVAYYCRRPGGPAPDPDALYAHLRERLPAYMVPAFLEELDAIPMTPSNKADRKSLPPPTGARGRLDQGEYTAPATEVERVLATALAEAIGVPRVSAAADVFADLGANSLLIARFCARLRDRAELPPVSMKQVYTHRTVRALAAALDAVASAPRSQRVAPAAPTRAPHRASRLSYLLCGAAQLLFYLGYSLISAVVLDLGVTWVVDAEGMADTYLRAVVGGAIAFGGMSLLPIVAKWTLIGRWKPTEFPVWGLRYLRFWTVRTLMRFSPLALFAGSPLYNLYLRSLGARIGPGVAIFSLNPPVCADLLTIGAGTVIRKDSWFSCYHAEGGRISTGRVTLGADVFVGEATLLDIDTRIGDGGQIGHSSCLPAGQAVPAGESWHGSPAQPAGVDHRRTPPARCGRVRRTVFATVQVLRMLLVYAPAMLIVTGALTEYASSRSIAGVSGVSLYEDDMALSGVLEFGAIIAGLVSVMTLPRIVNLVLRPGRVYPLYGLRYAALRAVGRMTNIPGFTKLFGDSSFIVWYLRNLGYDLANVEQTGSNFGLAVKHESPYVSRVGSGTLVSDGLSFANVEYSSTSFRVGSVAIGDRNFVGNNIVYPVGGRTGRNCLLATKVMIPLDGEVREDVGLLGSPPFEIPRSVARDADFDHLKTPTALRRALAAKNRHNLGTIALYLLTLWVRLFGVILIAAAAGSKHGVWGALVWSGALLAMLGYSVGYSILVERAATGFRRLRPRFCSIYDPIFWRHERFWKLSVGGQLGIFNGTPFKTMILRAVGVRCGRMVFDDGCGIPEKTLVTIGDHCTLGAASVIQGHSLEDGAFKSDHIVIGNGCTIAANAFVHYGTHVGDGAVIDPDSFLMKGTTVLPGARWRGNPAMEVTE